MSEADRAESSVPPRPRRVIKRYSNRKLYDTQASSYVTLLNIAEMVRAGEDVQIIDNATKEDKTDLTLALIISEEVKANPREIPMATVKALVRSRGGRLMSQLREGPIGKFIPTEGEEGARHDGGAEEKPMAHGEGQPGREGAKGFRATIEQWQATVDERIRAVLPHFAGFQEMQKRIEDLTHRVEALEKKQRDERSND